MEAAGRLVRQKDRLLLRRALGVLRVLLLRWLRWGLYVLLLLLLLLFLVLLLVQGMQAYLLLQPWLGSGSGSGSSSSGSSNDTDTDTDSSSGGCGGRWSNGSSSRGVLMGRRGIVQRREQVAAAVRRARSPAQASGAMRRTACFSGNAAPAVA